MRCSSLLTVAATLALASAQPRFRGQTMGNGQANTPGESLQSGLLTKPLTTPMDTTPDGLLGDNTRGFRPHDVSLNGAMNDPPLAAATATTTTRLPVLGESPVSGRGTRTPAPSPTVSPNWWVYAQDPIAPQTDASDEANTRGFRPRGVALNGGTMSEPTPVVMADAPGGVVPAGIMTSGDIPPRPIRTPPPK